MASKLTWLWIVRALIALVALGSLIATISFGGHRGDPAPSEPSSPAPPSEVPTGARVAVPEVVGLDLASARRILLAAGLVAGTGTLADDPPQLWSVVRVQEPQPGTELPQGESVFVIVTRQERPDLELPQGPSGPCPATPVHPSPGLRLAMTTEHARLGSATQDGAIRLDDYPRVEGGVEVSLLWSTARGYKGPLLVRGDRIDGTGELVFLQDPEPVDNRLIPPGTPSEFHFDRGGPPGGFAWTTVVTFPEPGCYAFQIDGPKFTEHLIVEAI